MNNASNTLPARIEYRTPLGCFDTWEDAANACERADFDPCTCIEIVKVTR